MNCVKPPSLYRLYIFFYCCKLSLYENFYPYFKEIIIYYLVTYEQYLGIRPFVTPWPLKSKKQLIFYNNKLKKNKNGDDRESEDNFLDL